MKDQQQKSCNTIVNSIQQAIIKNEKLERIRLFKQALHDHQVVLRLDSRAAIATFSEQAPHGCGLEVVEAARAARKERIYSIFVSVDADLNWVIRKGNPKPEDVIYVEDAPVLVKEVVRRDESLADSHFYRNALDDEGMKEKLREAIESGVFIGETYYLLTRNQENDGFYPIHLLFAEVEEREEEAWCRGEDNPSEGWVDIRRYEIRRELGL